MTQCSAFWLARFDNEEDLINYIEYHHDADGNASSPFDAALGGPGYDDDFLECVYTDPEDLAEEVGDFSHSEHFGADLQQRIRAIGGTWNTLLMLTGAEGAYNEWLFHGEPAETPAPHLRFVGRFTYDTPGE
ncbi:immunity 22 family protein [Flaviaesturariibacter aridisoli]|nr:immunity 22 family protein [Flaviaesturariibacter aridisoli]